MVHEQEHKQHRVGWLRAAVLGANDGIISISSLIVGVAAASTSHDTILLTGVAGLVAGAISMAAGEYVSVCTQSDTEKSDLAIEQRSLDHNFESELHELASIYELRGVSKDLSLKVAQQMMKHDALASHARDDIGISVNNTAQPILAAGASAISFTIGAICPLLIALISPSDVLITTVSASTLLCLGILGATSAYLSGAKIYIGILRITFWGAFAMLATAYIGELTNTVI